jgi:hypothetical protein
MCIGGFAQKWIFEIVHALNSFADSFLTPARSNCQFFCSDDIPKRSPKQKKIHQNEVKNAPARSPSHTG